MNVLIKTTTLFLSGLLLVSANIDNVQAAATVTSLRCEDRIEPLGIDVAKPRFSWKMESNQRGEVQTAYQLIVEGVWDSGVVQSSQSIQVEYGGPALLSSKDYRWKVRVWDAAGSPTPYSTSAKFSTGLNAWTAKWIGRDEPSNENIFGAAQWIWFSEGVPNASAPLAQRFFKKDFTLAANPKRAVVAITADDQFEVFVNGTKAGAWENFSQTREFDITALLHAGNNRTHYPTSISPKR